MKVLAISASPRRNGNTELLLKEAIRGAEEAGAKVKLIRLRELRITPCLECLSCHKDGRCVVQDDMQRLYPELLEMDGLIFASPIFFMGITAWGKGFIDRCQPFWAMKYVLKGGLPIGGRRRKGIFISVGGTRYKFLFDGPRRVMKSLFHVLDVEYEGEVLVRGVDEKGEILKHPEALELAYELGKGSVKNKKGGNRPWPST